MSIIQKIRDKAAWIVISAIALALIAFIVQDAFQNQNMFRGDTTTMGVIDGKKVEVLDFEEKYKRAEEQYRQAGYPLNDMMKGNIRESLWSEFVDDAIMKDKYGGLGIEVSDKELSDILYGANPPQDLRQQFTDPNTGLYDPNAAYQQIQALKKQKSSPMYKSFFGQYLPALAKSRQKEKYISLISNSTYVPKWLVEKIIADNSQKASISYVNIPYSSVSDSAVTVSDNAITDYVNSHKEEYKQERARSFEYVMFDAGPTKADSSAIFDQINAVKDEFKTTDDIPAFFVRNGSESQFANTFEMKSRIQSSHADSLIVLNDGEVSGPFLDGGNYTLAKMLGKRSLPDSVKVRHILIKIDATHPDTVAKARIDSIVNAIRGGANFDSMVVKFSDDQGSIQTGGVYEFSSAQMGGISKEFAEVAFFGNAGDKKTVKVQNSSYSGYHYIEVLTQKKFEQAYKIAYFSKPVLPSDETINREMGLASQFAAESRDKKSFDENAKKRNLNKIIATDIKPLDAMIAGLGSSRELVKWLYEAKRGDIADRPFQVEDKYVVPLVTQILEEGTMSAAKARPLVENVIRNREKAKRITEKIASAKTLEAVAQTSGLQITKADSIVFSSSFIPNVGQEVKVIGASFFKEYEKKISEPIEGNLGVFVIKIDGITASPNTEANIAEQQAALQQNQQRAFSDPRVILEILKKTVKIKDDRYKFF